MLTIKDILNEHIFGVVFHNGYYICSSGGDGILSILFDGDNASLIESDNSVINFYGPIDSDGANVLVGKDASPYYPQVSFYSYSGPGTFINLGAIVLAGTYVSKIKYIGNLVGEPWSIVLTFEGYNLGRMYMVYWNGYTYDYNNAHVITGIPDFPRSVAYDPATGTLFLGICNVSGEIRAYHFEPHQPLVYLGSTNLIPYPYDMTFHKGRLCVSGYDEGLVVLDFDGYNFVEICRDNTAVFAIIRSDQYYIYASAYLPITYENHLRTYAINGSEIVLRDSLNMFDPSQGIISIGSFDINGYPNIGLFGYPAGCGGDICFFGINHQHEYSVGFSGTPRSGVTALHVAFTPVFGPDV
jgi:WD40 repeat protein